MQPVLASYIISQTLISLVLANTPQWNCPSNSRYCYQSIQQPQTWNQTRSYCASIGAQLPGARHLNEMRNLKQIQPSPFWTSLCFSQGRLQWLGSNPYEVRDLSFFDTLLHDLTSLHITSDLFYCYYASGDLSDPLKVFGLALKDGAQVLSAMCVSDKKTIHQPAIPGPKGRIRSVKVVSFGADVDWGPIGQDRQGFINISPSKFRSFRLKCDVQTNDPEMVVNYRWRRNSGYMGNRSQEIEFSTVGDLIKWIGFISCEPVYPGIEDPYYVPYGQGIHLVLWNTVTLRIISGCTSCSLQSVLDAAKIILTQFVENEIRPGMGRDLEFYNEPPVIQRSSISFVVHLRNRRIDRFDFRMVHKLGAGLFGLSSWAKNRSLLLPSGSDLLVETISPCNMALPQDRNTNTSWIGYLGQIVPSNNFIGGPICLDRTGEVVTRSCGLSVPNEYKECLSMRPRREEPRCFHGFSAADGRCYRMTEEVEYANALSQCWAGWQMHPNMLQASLSNWVQDSISWIARTRPDHNATLIWLPLRRPNKAAPLQIPLWTWNTLSNQWIPETSVWNVTQDGPADEQCAAYHLERGIVVSQSCQSRLSMVCTRPRLSRRISSLIASQPDHVGEYFCPPGWITHWLVLDAGLCYRRFVLPDPVTWDEAREECLRRGSDLATAPNPSIRVALEQVYAFFNNQSSVDSWIGLRNPGTEPGVFRWTNHTTKRSSTFNWHPYSEFGEGYGVSTGNSRMWWNWPRDAKLWGLVCQKNVSSWKDDLRIRLEPSSGSTRVGDYALILSYDPQPVIPEEDARLQYESVRLLHQTFVKKFFWQSEIDVLCHFANHARHFSVPIGQNRQYRARVSVPSALGSGQLSCEAWLNRPAYRFYSNSILHRPSNTFSFVFHVPSYYRDSVVVELIQRSRVLQEIMTNPTITSSGLPNLIRLSFSIPFNVPLLDLFAFIRRCNSAADIRPDMELEHLLHAMLIYCLPLTNQRGEALLVDVRSTVACPAETGRGDQLSWPRTPIGRTTRPLQLCMTSSTQLVHRTCGGSFEQGATWEEVLNSTAFTCQTPSSSVTKLHQLERISSRSQLDDRTVTTILSEMLMEWDQQRYPSVAEIELTVNILRQLLDASSNVKVNRMLVAVILERMVRPGHSPLPDLQRVPHVLDDFIRLFSDLPVADGRGPRARLNLGDQVSIVAEGNSQSPSLTFDFDRLTVNITKDPRTFGNRLDQLTVVTLLPTELLAIDPVTRSNQVQLFKSDPTDRDHVHFMGYYTAEGTTADVQLRTSPEVGLLSSPLTLTFKTQLPWDSEALCARWDSTGRWLMGDCWYMGSTQQADSVHHTCQCHLAGTYGLFTAGWDLAALMRQLPIIITAALFTIIALCLAFRSICIYRKVVHEMDLVEMGARLQLLAAWLFMLLCHLSHYFVTGRSIGCIALATAFQFCLTAAFMWLFTLLLVRHWQIMDRWMGNQKTFLVKLSFAIWGLSSILIVTVPIYKWKFFQPNEDDVIIQCQLEDPVDFGLTLAIVCVGSLASIIMLVKNNCDLVGDSGLTRTSESLSALSTALMSVAGILVVMNSSWYHSMILAVLFGCVSSILGVVWLYIFWTLLPSPLVSHSFQHGPSNNTRTIGQDLHLKPVYGSSIEYLTSSDP